MTTYNELSPKAKANAYANYVEYLDSIDWDFEEYKPEVVQEYYELMPDVSLYDFIFKNGHDEIIEWLENEGNFTNDGDLIY